MKKSAKILFIIIVLLQVGYLFSLIISRNLLLKNGKRVILNCKPIHSRSLFLGGYIHLNYEISVLPMSLLNPDQRHQDFNRGDTIYVGLEKREGENYWEPVAVSKDFFSLNIRFPSIIRGKVYYSYADRIVVTYGVETYYIPLEQGNRIPENDKSDVQVEIALTKNGYSAVRRIFINRVEVEFR